MVMAIFLCGAQQIVRSTAICPRSYHKSMAVEEFKAKLPKLLLRFLLVEFPVSLELTFIRCHNVLHFMQNIGDCVLQQAANII